jgi:hypothetical protein
MQNALPSAASTGRKLAFVAGKVLSNLSRWLLKIAIRYTFTSLIFELFYKIWKLLSWLKNSTASA